jgi:hypothetical protein
MNTQLATDVRPRARRSARSLVVSWLGPLAIAAGVVWALLQPWRITVLHPHGQGLWWLLAEPPLLVLLAGAVFALAIAPGLLEDLDE